MIMFIQAIIVIAFTFLLIYDFFPHLLNLLIIPPEGLKYLIILVIFIALFIPKYRKNVEEENFKFGLISFVYILGLTGLFTLLGGKSSSGLFDGVIIWVLVVVYLFKTIKYIKNKNNKNL